MISEDDLFSLLGEDVRGLCRLCYSNRSCKEVDSVEGAGLFEKELRGT